MRSDSTLRSLTPDQLDDLFDWIGTYSIRVAIERAAKPAPDGFNLRLHKNTLVRFFKAEERKRHAQELAELALVDEGAPEIARLIKAAKVDFAHSVYELARCVDSDSFARLESALHRIERCEIDREKVGLRKEEIALHRERLAMDRLHGEFSIATELLKSAPEYMDIRKRDDIHDENKVWLARERAFGVSPLAPFPRCEADRHPPQPQGAPGSIAPIVSLSAGGPLFAGANVVDGQLNGGGLAKPLGGGEVAVSGPSLTPSSEAPAKEDSFPSVQHAAAAPVQSDTLIHANAQSDAAQVPDSLSAGGEGRGEVAALPTCLPSFPSVQPTPIAPVHSDTLIHARAPDVVETPSSPSENLWKSVKSVDKNLQPAPGAPAHSDTLIHANAQNEPVSPSSLPSVPSVEDPAPSAGDDAVPPPGDSASRSAAPGYFARFP